MFAATVATAVFELLYVKAPSPLVVGGTRAKDASPTAFVGTVKLDKTVVNELTRNTPVMVADV
jgi:hypothetical protein